MNDNGSRLLAIMVLLTMSILFLFLGSQIILAEKIEFFPRLLGSALLGALESWFIWQVIRKRVKSKDLDNFSRKGIFVIIVLSCILYFILKGKI